MKEFVLPKKFETCLKVEPEEGFISQVERNLEAIVGLPTLYAETILKIANPGDYICFAKDLIEIHEWHEKKSKWVPVTVSPADEKTPVKRIVAPPVARPKRVRRTPAVKKKTLEQKRSRKKNR